MSQTSRESQPPPISPDDTLPPVEPPTAGFLLQLFIVPGVIVLIIVMVWLLFNWLAHMGDDPRGYVDALRRDNAARWQKAASLADWLRREGNEPVKRDRALARDLAALLAEQIEDGLENRSAEDINLRAFLCKALGEFHVDEGLPVLLLAAKTGHEDELLVRRAAIESIALLAQNVRPEGSLAHPDLMSTLKRASSDAEAGIRAPAAFALGVVASDEALERLDQMLGDAHPTVRYNAATGLARHGRETALGVLVEMLDPDTIAGVEEEIGELAQLSKRITIRKNALEAVSQLIKRNPDIPIDTLLGAIDKLLVADDLEGPIRVGALSVKRELEALAEMAVTTS
jgi:hypothetical protein